MGYDLTSVKTPRLSGLSLRTAVTLTEHDTSRRILAPLLNRDLGVNTLRNACLSVAPTFLPQYTSHQDLSPIKAKATLAFYEQADFQPYQGKITNSFDLGQAYRDCRVSPSDVAEKAIQNITASNQTKPSLQAILITNEPDIRKQAKASEERYAKGEPLSWLDGVPIAVKDEIDTLPYTTMVGSQVFEQNPCVSQDATAVARLRAAGAIIIGKANMHEIGLGVTGANSYFGHCRNPYNLNHYAGGSSGGSAAAVASGLCPIAIGADGGGSIRIPSALCGAVGLKPTWGRVSKQGAFPLCWTVAHIGPIGSCVDDVTLAYNVMAGPDPLDILSCNQPGVHLSQYLKEDLSDIKIGIFPPWFSDAERDIVQCCQLAVEQLKQLGATTHNISINSLELQRVAHAAIISSEMRAAIDPYLQEERQRFGLDTRLILSLSSLFSSADYVKSQQVRTLAIQEFDQAFQEVDIIITPTTAVCAPAIQAEESEAEASLSTTTKLMRYSFCSNLTGLPSLSLPIGYNSKALPIGLQLIGKPWHEHTLLRIGRALEKRIDRQTGQIKFDLL